MVDEAQSILTPDEVGAIVAQWAERRKVDLPELARLLGVDEAQAASLLRQGRGRLHMNAWLQEKVTTPVGWHRQWVVAGGFLVLGAIVGGFAVYYLNQEPEKKPLPSIQVTSTEAASLTQPSPYGNSPANSMGKGTPGEDHMIRSNPDATEIGSDIGADLAKATVGIKNKPIAGLTATAVKVGGVPPPVSTLRAGSISATPIVTTPRIRHDMTGRLKAALPADVVIELFTPRYYYPCKGEVSKSVKLAGTIQPKGLTVPMCQLVSYAIRSDLAQEARQGAGLGNMGRIRIQVGQAVASMFLSWDVSKPESFDAYKKADNQIYTDLADQLLRDVKALGPRLFSEPKRPLDGGS